MSDKMPVRCLREEDIEEYDDFDMAEEFMALLADENNLPWTRKVGVYHPSSISGCKRALYYDRTSAPARNNSVTAMQLWALLGHAIHEAIQERFNRVEGFSCEERARFEALHLYGSCDGIFRIQDWVLEIKSIGDASFRRLTKPKKEHIDQAHCYMWCFDIPRAQILYMNRNTGATKTFRVKFSNERWEGITDVIAQIEDCVKNESPPPKEPSKFMCPNCKFFQLCKPDLK